MTLRDLSIGNVTPMPIKEQLVATRQRNKFW